MTSRIRPGRALITATRWPRKTASSMSWVMKTTVVPVRRQIAEQLLLQPLAGLRVEGTERLVHEQHLGLVGQAARDRDALLHAAGQLVRVAVGELGQPDQLEVVAGALGALPPSSARPWPRGRTRCWPAPCARAAACTAGTRRCGRARAR